MLNWFLKLKRNVLFAEANPLVFVGKQRILQSQDALVLPRRVDPRQASETGTESKIDWSSGKSLAWSLLRSTGPVLYPGMGLYLVSIVFALATPVFVNRFVAAISTGVTTDESLWQALIFAVLLGSSTIIRGLCVQHYFFRSLMSFQQMVNLINEKVFRHSLRMTQEARLKTPVGDIVNHMSSDTESIGDFSMVLPDAIFTVVSVLGVSSLLFFYIGWSAVVPLVLMAALAPATKVLAKRFTHLDEVMMKERDRRVTLMTQILNAIRVVKYFAWERSVQKEVAEVRQREIRARRQMAQAEVVSGVAYVGVSAIVLFVALAVHAYRGFNLDPALVFTCVSLFGLLEEPFGGLSRLISRWTNAFVSAGRVSKFLQTAVLPEKSALPASSAAGVGLQVNGLSSFDGWSLHLPAGSAMAVVGPVGGGKSTLLLSLIGENPQERSAVQFISSEGKPVMARTAYVPQEAYIVNGSLEENIRFGEGAATRSQLEEAVQVSCFDQDLRELPAGFNTEIGEKGVNLSGGQKQRVGLARAWLHRPQIAFLDDPLSAVDVETEQRLCERLIFGSWAQVTRIVATHRLEFLSRFDRILFVDGGRVLDEGTYPELLAKSSRFREFVREHEKTQGHGTSEETKTAIPATAAGDLVATAESRVTEDEERETGAVKGSVYGDYLRSLGGEGRWQKLNLFLLFAGASSVMALPLLQRWWLGMTASYQEKGTVGAIGQWLIDQGWSHWMQDPKHSVMIYGCLGLCALGFTLMNGMWWLERGIRAGQLLHDRMLKSILKSSVRFFDSTPVGRIIQRFSRDVESVDIYLQWSFDSAIHCLIEVVLSLVLIVTVVPIVLVILAPILFFYYLIQRDYRRPAREAKRLDSIARSPRYAHFKETLMGLPVIRGFQRESWFLESFFAKLHESQRMFYSHYMLNRWFSARVPLIGGLISMATAMAAALTARDGTLSPGTAGLLTIYALSFWGYLNWGVRIFADIESRMTSVERLRTYGSLIPEQETVLPAAELAADWPRSGALSFHGVQARYAEHLPLVLKGVSFAVASGERVGLIGRTGSGKSTLFQTLFRFVELEKGEIFLDGVNIAAVPLERLRRALAIIPQDPTLFLGTIRSNLDRYREYDDREIIAALEKAAMWDFVSQLPGQLEFAVAENGLNLSQGQRQLLCLARALLCRVKVIVLDEATASVDVQTDALLQKVIRENLQGVSLLIIAHRLGTVADCDQIVELAGGQVKSVLHPREDREALAEIESEELD